MHTIRRSDTVRATAFLLTLLTGFPELSWALRAPGLEESRSKPELERALGLEEGRPLRLGFRQVARAQQIKLDYARIDEEIGQPPGQWVRDNPFAQHAFYVDTAGGLRLERLPYDEQATLGKARFLIRFAPRSWSAEALQELGVDPPLEPGERGGRIVLRASDVFRNLRATPRRERSGELLLLIDPLPLAQGADIVEALASVSAKLLRYPPTDGLPQLLASLDDHGPNADQLLLLDALSTIVFEDEEQYSAALLLCELLTSGSPSWRRPDPLADPEIRARAVQLFVRLARNGRTINVVMPVLDRLVDRAEEPAQVRGAARSVRDRLEARLEGLEEFLEHQQEFVETTINPQGFIRVRLDEAGIITRVDFREYAGTSITDAEQLRPMRIIAYHWAQGIVFCNVETGDVTHMDPGGNLLRLLSAGAGFRLPEDQRNDLENALTAIARTAGVVGVRFSREELGGSGNVTFELAGGRQLIVVRVRPDYWNVQVLSRGLEELEVRFTTRPDGSVLGTTRIPAEFPSGARLFYHPGMDVAPLALGDRAVLLPEDPELARQLLESERAGDADLILLPDSIGQGQEGVWRPQGAETPILVLAPSALQTLSARLVAALAAVARRAEGQVLRAGLGSWTQEIVESVEYLSVQM